MSNVRKYRETGTSYQERELLANDRAERAVRTVPLLIRSTNPIGREDPRNDSIHREYAQHRLQTREGQQNNKSHVSRNS